MTYKIKENAKNVWIRNNENTQDLSPLTDANSVYFNNGRTLEQELGKGVMESNVVTIDSAMSKVIDEAYDGVYESCVFKGRSLVNLSNLHRSFEDATLSGYYCDTSLCETSKLKLETPYTLMFYTTVHGGDHDIYNTIELGVGDILHGVQGHPHTTTNYRGTLVKNGWSRVCVSFTDFLGYKYLSLRPIRCNAPESGKSIRFSIKGFILLEGDWSNKDLPFNDYFEGICDVKMPILHNVGKNLFDPSKHHHLTSRGDCYSVDETSSGVNTVEYVLEPNSQYILSFNKYGTNSCWISVTINGAYTNNNNTNYSKAFTTNSTGKTTIKIAANGENDKGHTISNIMLRKATDGSAYEDHKTNILRTPEEIVLREVNGVQDTYNAITGKYVQRIGERDYIEGDFTDVNVKTDGVKTQYELTEPVTTIVEPSTIPFIYQNGHIILESGYKGQSLTPILEYTASVSRTGQVENVAKTIQRHETQLTLLEKMLIGNIIELDYNNTLMALNLKMDEVK